MHMDFWEKKVYVAFIRFVNDSLLLKCLSDALKQWYPE